MFGVAVARLEPLSDAEKQRYQAFYCGLCRTLKQRYGQLSRAVLSYDLAFLVIFLDSLSESSQDAGADRCIVHPKKRMPFIQSANTAYAADLSVALAYHKVLDDVADDDTMRARAARVALRGAYERAQERIPDECAAIEACMERIHELEGTSDTPPDACAQEFGRLMGALFASGARRAWDARWAQACGTFGETLGRLIYLMDAAVDLPTDQRTGSYNPFAALTMDVPQMRQVLTVVAADAALAFERLPLVQDAQLMRAVLYAGIWQKFNRVYEDQAHPAEAPDQGVVG